MYLYLSCRLELCKVFGRPQWMPSLVISCTNATLIGTNIALLPYNPFVVSAFTACNIGL